LLTAGITDFAEFIDAHCTPNPELELAFSAASSGVHAMTDISDGLVSELRTMARASGLCLRVDPAAIPVPARLAEAAAVLDTDPVRWMIGGGEDHELLAAFAPAELPAGWTAIGSVHPADTGLPVAVAGLDPAVMDEGWRTF
jgi:thiamine-monophosphate kinase